MFKIKDRKNALYTLLGTVSLIMSQPINHMTGKYLKTIEYNVLHKGVTEETNIYNLKHKSAIDRVFFGTKNSFIEFVFVSTPEESNEAVALRIIKNKQDNSYELEVMCLQNIFDVYYKKLNMSCQKRRRQ